MTDKPDGKHASGLRRRGYISDLHMSLRVTLAGGYEDGTVWFTVADALDRYGTVCVDGRIDCPTRWRLFDGARHPKDEHAILVKLGCPLEGIVVPLLSHWLDTPEPRTFLTEFGCKMLKDALVRLGEPILPRAEQE